MDEEQATIDSQFTAFAKLFDAKKRTGETITLWNSDYWMRQANIIDDRKVTMTDTGIIFNKYGKSEIDFDEWMVFLAELCEMKQLNLEKIIETLTNSGLPGESPVEIPQYRTFFLTFKSKNALEGSSNGIYCNATCDGYLCWPSTPAGETSYQNCPKALLSNEKMCAFRRCGAEGQWLGRHLNESSPKGWTNYTPCFPTLVQKILDKVNEDEAEAQLKFKTAVNTRTIEMVGIVSSLLTIIAAIIIFNAFPSLQNRRTEIHRNLFYALLMEVSVRLILYTQQSHAFDEVDTSEEDARKGIEYFPYVCEGAYVLLEYSRLVVYGWMFIEGIFLNTLVSANTLRNEIPINYFYVGGWGVPAIVIAIWATVVGKHYSGEPLNTCWYGYNYLPSYYIIQGPILGIVLLNMLFLGTIMSVIIMKLRRTNDSELRKIQKTIRATLILLPLLGIINIFNLFDYPLDGSSTGFAIWAYFTHFFRSFQGVFISSIYCFSNGEVRKAIKKKFERRIWFRFSWLERRQRALAPIIPRQRPIFAISDNENMELVSMPQRTWARPSSTHMVSDIDAGTSQLEAMAQKENPPPTPRKLKLPTISTVDIALSFAPRTESPEICPGISIRVASDDNLSKLADIKVAIRSSQEFEPAPQPEDLPFQAPDPRPDLAEPSTSAGFPKPQVADATTSPPEYSESASEEASSFNFYNPTERHRFPDRIYELAPTHHYSQPRRRSSYDEPDRQLYRYPVPHNSRRSSYDEQDRPQYRYPVPHNPRHALHQMNRIQRDTRVVDSYPYCPQHNPIVLDDGDIPPFTRPAAVPRRNLDTQQNPETQQKPEKSTFSIARLICGVGGGKKKKRASSLDDPRRVEVYAPRGSSSGNQPHTITHRAARPYVRSSSEDSARSGAGAITKRYYSEV